MALGISPDSRNTTDSHNEKPRTVIDSAKKSIMTGVMAATAALSALVPAPVKAGESGATATSALAALVPAPTDMGGVGAPRDGRLAEMPKVKHVHHDNYFTVGVEGGAHGLMAQAGVFHEVAPHLSVGLVGGIGSTLDGMPTGAAEVMAAYHKSIRGKVFAVLEAGGGVDFLREEHGVHTSPIAKVTGLVGYHATPDVGIFAGPSLIVNSHGDPSGSVSVGTVVEF